MLKNFLTYSILIVLVTLSLCKFKKCNNMFDNEKDYPNEVNDSIKLYLNEKYLQIGRLVKIFFKFIFKISLIKLD